MFGRIRIPLAALGAFAMFVVVSAGPSAALTAKECSAKYKTAKTAGTLGGQTWSEFRKKRMRGRRTGHRSGSGRSSVSEKRRSKVCQKVCGQGPVLHVP